MLCPTCNKPMQHKGDAKLEQCWRSWLPADRYECECETVVIQPKRKDDGTLMDWGPRQ